MTRLAQGGTETRACAHTQTPAQKNREGFFFFLSLQVYGVVHFFAIYLFFDSDIN